MGRLAIELSDSVVVISDTPRTEDLAWIAEVFKERRVP